MKKIKLFLILLPGILLSLMSCESEDVVEVTACFSILSSEYNAGEEISFNNCSTRANTFSWDFGDGETSSDEAPMHTYSTGGEYTITLVASFDSYEDTYSKKIMVEELTKEATFNNNTPSVITIYYADEELTEANLFNTYDGYAVVYSGYNTTIDFSLLGSNNLYYFAITSIQSYSPITYLYWSNSVSGGETKDIDVGSTYYHLTVANSGYSTITGPEIFYYYGNGNDISDYNQYSYEQSITVGNEYEFGYYYQDDSEYYAIGFWYNTEGSYVYWSPISFTDENCVVYLRNSSFKSNQLEAEVIKTHIPIGSDCHPKVGTLSKEALAKLPK